jgi:hypothetical protein
MAIGSRLCLLVAGVTVVAGSAFAQAPNPEATPGDAPAQNQSKKLNQSNGVIHPKEVTRPSRIRFFGLVVASQTRFVDLHGMCV